MFSEFGVYYNTLHTQEGMGHRNNDVIAKKRMSYKCTFWVCIPWKILFFTPAIKFRAEERWFYS